MRVLRGTSPGILLDTLTFDGLGRASVQFDRVRSRKDSMAWRRTTTYYNAANQVDSVVNEKSENCLPCYDPPATGYTLEQRVSNRFDRAGRDSVRLNATGKATAYLYDRLGRLLKRTPPTGGTPPSDVMVYDVAGNLVRTITRRGDTITTDYDSRNRDTLSVIPGVGTLRRAYGGPLDQLTRVWFDSPVDSIGGLTGTVAYVYDKRGRLTADSAWTGATARVSTFSYDTLERVIARVDPTGTWTTRYDAVRGYPNKLITPFSDSLEYTLDSQGRATTAPRVLSSGSTFLRSLSLTPTSGSLAVLDNTVGAWNAGRFDPEPASENGESAPLNPAWTEQHGSGTATDSIVDLSTADSWGRVKSWSQSKNGTAVGGDTYTFDSTGSVSGGSSYMTFDGTTDRLSTRLDYATGYSWAYSYDAAGNQIQAAGTKSGQPNLTWDYGYDALGQVRSVRYNATLIARYGYDVLGRRIAKRVYSAASGGTVGFQRYVYTGDHVAFETDSGGTIKTKYTWGADIDDLVAMTDSSGGTWTTYYAIQDQLRSVRGLVKRDGTWLVSQRFSPYGRRLARDTAAAAIPALRYGWTGREYDPETGFYYLRARYLDPTQLRFTQEDPIGYGGGDNLYAFANGSVLDSRDPYGLNRMLVCAKWSSYWRLVSFNYDGSITWQLETSCARYEWIDVGGGSSGGGGPGGGSGGGGGGGGGNNPAPPTAGAPDLPRDPTPEDPRSPAADPQRGDEGDEDPNPNKPVIIAAGQKNGWKGCPQTNILFNATIGPPPLQQGLFEVAYLRTIDYFKLGRLRIPVPGGVGVYSGTYFGPVGPAATLMELRAQAFVHCGTGAGAFEAYMPTP